MTVLEKNAPEFMVIGAQKAGTTWLWSMLDQHPGTSLPVEKEIHYFGSSELYARGDDWYYNYFRDLDSDKVIGEASTSYFYDSVPYWFNESDQLEFDNSLPVIPELISQKFPDMKFIVVLRDPVRRAISAYSHWMKQGEISPFLGLRRVATEHRRLRILEYGFYARYLDVWMKSIPSDRMRIIIFEDQIEKNWDQTLIDTYGYLGLDSAFTPELPGKSVHRGWGWSRITFNYYASRIFKDIGDSSVGRLIDRFDYSSKPSISADDIEFLRAAYLPEKEQIARLTGNRLNCWDYGEKMLQQLTGQQ